MNRFKFLANDATIICCTIVLSSFRINTSTAASEATATVVAEENLPEQFSQREMEHEMNGTDVNAFRTPMERPSAAQNGLVIVALVATLALFQLKPGELSEVEPTPPVNEDSLEL